MCDEATPAQDRRLNRDSAGSSLALLETLYGFRTSASDDFPGC